MKRGFFYFTLLIIIFSGCKKSDEFSLVSFTELYPIQVGKVFYYRLDSTLPSNSRQQLVKVSYNAKDSIESQFLDNTGRKSFRVYRYLRDTSTPISNNSNWKFNIAYSTTFDENKLERSENNLRFVSLTNPVREGSKWYGTQQISTSSAALGFYAGWNFEYQHTDEPYTVKKGSIEHTYTIAHIDETNPEGPLGSFQIKTFSMEVYAKGIGLIYKDLLHYNYQANSGGYQVDDFGIRLSLIDYK